MKDNEQIYDSQIAPLMDQIIAICQKHSINMQAAFEMRGTETGCDLCTTAIMSDVGPWHPLARAVMAINPPELHTPPASH